MTALYMKSTLLCFSLMVLSACGYLDVTDSTKNSIIRFSEEHLYQFYDCFCKQMLTCTAVYNYTKATRYANHTQDFYEITAIKQRYKPAKRQKGDSFFNTCLNNYTPRKSGQIECEKKSIACQTIKENSLFHFRQTCNFYCKGNEIVYSKNSDPFRLDGSFVTCTPDCQRLHRLTTTTKKLPVTSRTESTLDVVEDKTTEPTRDDVSSTAETKETNTDKKVGLIVTVLKPVTSRTESMLDVVEDETTEPTRDDVSSTAETKANETKGTNSDTKLWLIVGAVVGLVNIVLIIIGVAICYWRRSKKGSMSLHNSLVSESSDYGGTSVTGESK